MSTLTPFQTVGPFFDFGLIIPGGETIAQPSTPGRHIAVEGTIRDGAGDPLPDALVEIWQADAAGTYRHPADNPADNPDRCTQRFDGFGRIPTGDDGRFAFTTVMPGRVPGPGGALQAPHLVVSVLARGVLTRLATRMYFEDDPANQEDPVLALVPEGRRATLIAEARRRGPLSLRHRAPGKRGNGVLRCLTPPISRAASPPRRGSRPCSMSRRRSRRRKPRSA